MFAVIFCAGLLSLTTNVVQGKCIETPHVPDGITVHKIISTWEEADQHCKSEDAVLASPINTDLLNTMKSLIGFNNAQYFIGTKVSHYPGPFVSVEGVPLDNMTTAVLEMIQQLDPRDGDCLSMDENSIRVVPCCIRLPFMCYKAKVETVNTTTNLPIEIIDQNSTTIVSGTESKTAWETDSGTVPKNVSTTTSTSTSTTESTSTSTMESTIVSEQDVTQTLTTQSTEPANSITLEDFQEYPCKTNDPGYKYYNDTGSCYKKHTELKWWDDASATCEAENAHLLVIDDNNEVLVFKNEMDLSDVAPFAFIGLRDYNRDGNWKTVTGKTLSEIYLEWYPGAPRVADMTCGTIYPTGLVDNLYCDTAKSFICEKEITQL